MSQRFGEKYEQNAEPSNLHHPTSCYRPALNGNAADPETATRTFVDWPVLKQHAWAFLDMPSEGETLEFICPYWWNATGCECTCGDCSELFKECPVGFMLFRAISLLCAANGAPNTRLHELVYRHWGSGLTDFGRLLLGFKDILHSGWPYFGVLTKIAEQLSLDGVTEHNSMIYTQRIWGERALKPASSYCASLGWPEDTDFMERARNNLDDPSSAPMPLEMSMLAAADAESCPLQKAVANAAVVDFLLRPSEPPKGRAGFNEAPLQTSSLNGLSEVEHVIQKVELSVRKWADANSEENRAGRPYFFEMLVVKWPVWRMLHRVGLRLVAALTLSVCHGSGGEKFAAGAGRTETVLPPPFPLVGGVSFASSSLRASIEAPSGTNARIRVPKVCPACDCMHQGEWAVESRYVTEYSEILSRTLFVRAACNAPMNWRGGSVLWQTRVRRLAQNTLMSWRQRWSHLSPAHLNKEPLEISQVGAFNVNGAVPLGRREAFITVLFAQGSAADKIMLHTDAIRTLAFSARLRSLKPRPFLVLTDGPLPAVAANALRADGLTLVAPDPNSLLSRIGATYGTGMGNQTGKTPGDEVSRRRNWWLERGILPTTIKLSIFNMTDYDRLVFLDADMLILDSIDELFDINVFAVGLGPYSAHGMSEVLNGALSYSRVPGINTGIMVVQPSSHVAELMARDVASGQHDNSIISAHLGNSDQPWLDTFWLSFSRRLGFARFSPPGRRPKRPQPGEPQNSRKFIGCDRVFDMLWNGERSSSDKPAGRKHQPWPASLRGLRSSSVSRSSVRQCPAVRRPRKLPKPANSGIGHCVLPIEYDFFADYKAIRTHMWRESQVREGLLEEEVSGATGQHYSYANMSAFDFATKRYVDDYDIFGDGGAGLKVLHWPGELRKPWQRWHKAVRGHWDQAWWHAYRHMCRTSSAPCHLSCHSADFHWKG